MDVKVMAMFDLKGKCTPLRIKLNNEFGEETTLIIKGHTKLDVGPRSHGTVTRYNCGVEHNGFRQEIELIYNIQTSNKTTL